jgi:hypothetical protein
LYISEDYALVLPVNKWPGSVFSAGGDASGSLVLLLVILAVIFSHDLQIIRRRRQCEFIEKRCGK